MLVRHELARRCHGALLKLLGSSVYLLFMVAVYTFVFGVVLKSNWSVDGTLPFSFPLTLFISLIVFSLFSECIARSPQLVLAHSYYVKRIVFPFEVLPLALLAGGALQFLINLCAWLILCALFFQIPPLSSLLLPLVILPLLLFTLGVSWILASLGTYLRNLGPLVGVLLTALLFLSPIFYPIEAVPESWRDLMYLNPLTLVIENTRQVMLWGRLPDLSTWSLSVLASAGVAWFGLVFFQRARGGFADVL
ncbi:ABC transporter permease [Pseudomonas vanderleydeniana]|uniref:Transport permease protein n=2 Tax=Pseudomonas vanderleydeniana TaxID=2745495 RepID=A0A9E6PRA4_9PSED|nr:ABC transporter permease [Pseudomonas vanderleydeniana]